MLAPTPFKTSDELGISESQHSALVQLLHKMERGEIDDDDFDMSDWKRCICGHAAKLGGNSWYTQSSLKRLFVPTVPRGRQRLFYAAIKVEQAATALRNYLTFDNPDWHEVMWGTSWDR
jgi:hypothetical protein